MACVYWIHLPEHSSLLSEGYIGYTTWTAEKRFKKHCEATRVPARQRAPLYRAIKKYGKSNLIVRTLCLGTPEYCLDLENKLRPTTNIGWNLGPGGAKTTLGRRATDEQRLHFSKVHSGRKWTEEQRQFMSALYKGKKLRLGSKMSETAKAKISAGNRGKKLSDETKRKMSESIKRVLSTPEARAKLSAVRKGTKLPHKAKWRHQRADIEMWKHAAEIFDLYQANNGRYKAEYLQRFGSKDKLFDLKKHFNRGWNPHTDPEYQAWKSSLVA
jgi:hypothetical protein